VIVILNVPVEVGVPETTPDYDPLRKLGKLVNVKVGLFNPIALNLTS
jgi:hypothetical protein